MPNFLKMGAAVDVRNHSFQYPTEFYGILESAVSANDTGASVESTNMDDLEYLVGTTIGDKFKLGVSSNALNIGVSEEVKINAISKTGSVYRFGFSDTVDYYYSEDDEISGTTTNYPAGWDFTRGNATITNYPICRILDTETVSEFETHLAADDFYSFKMKFVGSSTSTNRIAQDLTAKMLPVTYYRIGGIYKIKWNSGIALSSVGVRLYDTASNAIINEELLYSTSSSQPESWTEFNSVAVKSSATPTRTYFDFFHYGSGAYGCKLYLDCFYVEHAKNTDGDTSAVYTFTEYPVARSEKWSYEKFDQAIKQKDGAIKQFNTSGRMAKKWTYSCSFEQVSETFFKNLEILLAWQRNGSYLVLHTTELITYYLPTILVGKMKLTNIRQSSIDISKKDFTFIFEER